MRNGSRLRVVAVALVLAAPLVIGGGLALLALARSPLQSDVPAAPLVGQVQPVARPASETVTATWVAPVERVVAAQSEGTVTGLAIEPGRPIAAGDVVVRVDGLPVIAFAAPAPLYRDVVEGMEGDDVRSVQAVLVDRGLLDRVDGLAGPATADAIERWNASYGLPHGRTFARSSVIWIPEGATVPVDVSIEVGDLLQPPTPIYRAVLDPERVDVDIEGDPARRTVSLADATVPLPPGQSAISDPEDVAAIRVVMADQDTAAVVVTTAGSHEVGGVPASAVLTDDAGNACVLTDLDGGSVRIDPLGGSLGMVEVDARLIGTPLVINPREAGVGETCG